MNDFFTGTLQDVSPQFANRTVSDRPEDIFLDAVSYIGVILSIASLLLTIISYIGTRLVYTLPNHIII